MRQEKQIKLCSKKDRKSQSELYEIFSKKMFRLCFRYTGNTYDSEDILADGCSSENQQANFKITIT